MAEEEAAVAIVMRGRDEGASVQIRQLGQATTVTGTQFVQASVSAESLGLELRETGGVAQTSAAQFAQAGTTAATAGAQFRQALPSLASFGSSLASLLITTGALNSETGRYVTTALALTSAAASAIPSIGALIGLFRTLNITLRATAVAQAVLLGLSGVGLPLIATGLAAGAAVAGGIVLINRASERGSVARAQPAPVTVVNNGVMMGNEADAQRLADEIQRRIRENERIGR